MSIRTIACGATAAAALAGLPATASAMPAPPDRGFSTETQVQSAQPIGSQADGGISTAAVLVLAGGGLLVVAGGFEGGRVLARRRVLSH